MSIGPEEIINYRKRHGLTQKELADKVGVSIRTIQNYELGANIPSRKLEVFREILEQEKIEEEKSTLQQGDRAKYLEQQFKNISDQDVVEYIYFNLDRFVKNNTFRNILDSRLADIAIEKLAEFKARNQNN